PDPDNFSPDQFTSFAEFGIHFHSHRALSQQQIEQRFNEVRSWMSSFLAGAKGNALYMDTTTLYTVERLTELTGTPIVCSPSALLDLSNFVNAVVLYDHVFHLENDSLDSIKINEALGNERL